jgi:hypothetical protein
MPLTNINSPIQSCKNKGILDFFKHAKIVSVEFLDGGDNSILVGEGKQIVNLPSKDQWVDGTIVTNKDRLSEYPRIKVTFNKKGTHLYWLKFEPGADNTKYSPAEIKRNKLKFSSTEDEVQGVTGPDGIDIIANRMHIAVSGNDVYKVSASKDKGGIGIKSTGNIKTTRSFYINEVKMTGLTSVTSDISSFIKEFTDNYIEMIQLPFVQMDHIENINPLHSSEIRAFENKVNKAFLNSEGNKKSPYCVAIAYTDQLAIKLENFEKKTDLVEVGPESTPIKILIEKDGENKCLWHNIVSTEDWYVSCVFVKQNGDPNKDAKTIEESEITLIAPDSKKPHEYTSVSIDVTKLKKAKGNIHLKVNCVDWMAGGVSVGGGHTIAVCTRGFWENVSDAMQNHILIHEMGHKVGMVADGVGKSPDKVDTYYDKNDAPTHIGGHCHFGIPDSNNPFDKDDKFPNYDNAKCVMFGATKKENIKFCENCRPAIRKVDISSGF